MTPIEQEIVFLVISRENGSYYCTAAHSIIAEKVAKLDINTLDAVRSGGVLPDGTLQALASLTSSVFLSRGLITNAEAAAFVAVGYEER